MANTEQQLLERGLETEAIRQELKSEQQNSQDNELKEIEAQQEAEYANQLALDRAAYKLRLQAQKIYEEGQAYRHPSYFKYFVILLPWAGIVDIVDTLTLTGVMAILASIFSWFSWISIMLIMFFTDGKLSRAHEFTNSLESTVANLQEDIIRGTRLALRTSRVLRKVPGMKGVARQIPRTLVKIRKIARKNPILKVLVGGALNLIPLLSLLNLLIVWVYWAYLDERHAYKEASSAAEEASIQVSEMAAKML